MKKIALYGGAFSPPHLGHASVIKALLSLFLCDEIWIMPSADRHDKKVSAPGEHRLNMLELMITELFPNPKIPIVISDFELKINEPTVTHKTLGLLRDKYPDHQFYFVLGSENLKDIKTKWIDGDKLFKETEFIALKDPSTALPDELPPHITIIDITWHNISSTFIRQLLLQGDSAISFISKTVSEYIEKNNLYK
jgi:nicotinate-nucleotide adenylyltransferase